MGNAVSAGFTGGLRPGPAVGSGDDGIKAAVLQADYVSALQLFAYPYAAPAHDAKLRIVFKEWIGRILWGVYPLSTVIAGILHAVFHTVILKLAGAVLRAGEAVLPVVAHKEVQDKAPGFHHLF